MLHFPTEKVDAHITRIYAFGTELMYLIEGSEGNVLLDTGSGFGSLKAATDAILASHENTNPLKVLLTHGHVDHANGSGEYANTGIPVYMSMKDIYIYEKHASDAFRAAGLGMEQFEGHGTYVPEEDYIPSAALSDLHDGIIEDVCKVCEDIKNGNVDNVPFEFQGAPAKIAHVPDMKKGNIVYRPERIWKKDTVVQ